MSLDGGVCWVGLGRRRCQFSKAMGWVVDTNLLFFSVGLSLFTGMVDVKSLYLVIHVALFFF